VAILLNLVKQIYTFSNVSGVFVGFSISNYFKRIHVASHLLIICGRLFQGHTETL